LALFKKWNFIFPLLLLCLFGPSAKMNNCHCCAR
jgi:hypothetical protein